MQTREWILTAAVIVVPLIVAVVVTLWSLDQVRYRPKRRRAAAGVARETSASGSPSEQGKADSERRREEAIIDAREPGANGRLVNDAGTWREDAGGAQSWR